MIERDTKRTPEAYAARDESRRQFAELKTELTELTDLLKRVDRIELDDRRMWWRDEYYKWYVSGERMGSYSYEGSSLLEALRVLAGKVEP